MFFEQKGELLCLKMTPGFVRGGGAFTRRALFGFDDYDERYPSLGWLLRRWHNTIYAVLEPVLKKDEG